MNTEIQRRVLRAAIRAMFLTNPLVVATFTVLADLKPFGNNFAIGLIIAECATLVGFASGYGVVALEHRFYLRRGLPAPRRGKGHGLFVAALSLPLGVFVGLRLAAWIFAFRFEAGPNLLVGSGIGALVLLAYALVDGRSRLRAAETSMRLKDAELERVRLESRISVLTAQMNPHLLFNALNTAAERVHADPAEAEAMILELAELYRRVLTASRQHMHPLSAELELCRLYVQLQRARFGERLAYHVDVAEAVDAERLEVPCLVLQPLVENAMVHGIASRRGGGRVDVRVERGADRIVLEVSDDGVGLGASASGGTGTALENLRARLRLVYGDAAALELMNDEGVTARITLPAEEVRDAHLDRG